VSSVFDPGELEVPSHVAMNALPAHQATHKTDAALHHHGLLFAPTGTRVA